LSTTRFPVKQYAGFQQQRQSITLGALSLANNYELNAEPATFAVTGFDAGLLATRLLDAQPATFTITGTAASLVRDYELNAEPGAFTVTGVDATFEYVTVAAPPNTVIRANEAHTPRLTERVSQIIGALEAAALTNYELDAQPGSFTVTGLDAGLEYTLAWDKVVIPIYAVTTPQIMYGSRIFGGVSEEATQAYELNAEPGVFTVTGTAAGVLATRLLNAEPGAFTVTGVDATFVYGQPGVYSLSADPGSFTVTGAAATFLVTYVLNGESGSYSITGIDATLTATLATDLWQDHAPGSVLFTDHTAGSVLFTDHTPDTDEGDTAYGDGDYGDGPYGGGSVFAGVTFTDHTPD
jgi:hypothetical protein